MRCNLKYKDITINTSTVIIAGDTEPDVLLNKTIMDIFLFGCNVGNKVLENRMNMWYYMLKMIINWKEN